MKFSIKIDVSLDKDEIDFIRNVFMNDRDRSYHKVFASLSDSQRKYKVSKELLESLLVKSILLEDSIGNLTLSPIGQKVLDMIDRDKKINDLLYDTKS